MSLLFSYFFSLSLAFWICNSPLNADIQQILRNFQSSLTFARYGRFYCCFVVAVEITMLDDMKVLCNYDSFGLCLNRMSCKWWLTTSYSARVCTLITLYSSHRFKLFYATWVISRFQTTDRFTADNVYLWIIFYKRCVLIANINQWVNGVLCKRIINGSIFLKHKTLDVWVLPYIAPLVKCFLSKYHLIKSQKIQPILILKCPIYLLCYSSKCKSIGIINI